MQGSVMVRGVSSSGKTWDGETWRWMASGSNPGAQHGGDELLESVAERASRCCEPTADRASRRPSVIFSAWRTVSEWTRCVR